MSFSFQRRVPAQRPVARPRARDRVRPPDRRGRGGSTRLRTGSRAGPAPAKRPPGLVADATGRCGGKSWRSCWCRWFWRRHSAALRVNGCDGQLRRICGWPPPAPTWCRRSPSTCPRWMSRCWRAPPAATPRGRRRTSRPARTNCSAAGRHRRGARRPIGGEHPAQRRPGAAGQGHGQQHRSAGPGHHLCADPADRRGRRSTPRCASTTSRSAPRRRA